MYEGCIKVTVKYLWRSFLQKYLTTVSLMVLYNLQEFMCLRPMCHLLFHIIAKFKSAQLL